MKALAIGTSVLDILVQPVESIPPGQGAALVENIHITPAGTAGGTALGLKKLGFDTYVSSAIGNDLRGRLLKQLLDERGINTDYFQVIEGTPTTGSVIPIRKEGSRPALHLVGTEICYDVSKAPWDLIKEADVVHYGAPEFQGGEAVAKVLRAAKDGGAWTSADLLAGGSKLVVTWMKDALPYIDFLLPNEEQVLGFTGETDLIVGCRKLIDQGVTYVVCTCGGDGAVVVNRDRVTRIPAVPAKVVATDGAGDTFTAGFMRGIMEGCTPEIAAVWGSAAASYNVEAVGTDAGDYTDEDVRKKVEKFLKKHKIS